MRWFEGVYVDDSKIRNGTRKTKCFLVARRVEDLHEMARELNIDRTKFINAAIPHYMITQALKRQAKRMGAVEINHKEIITVAASNYRMFP